MNRMNINFVILIAFLMGNQLFNGPLSAQSIWLNQQGDKSIAIEILKPNFDGDDDLTFMSSALFLSGRFPLNDNILFVGELPLAYGGIDSDYGESDSEANIGNPYVGLEYRPQDSPVFVELGGRLPVTSKKKDLASLIGLWSDFDRVEAFAPDVITLSGKLNYLQTNASNLMFRLRGGPTLWLNSDEISEDDTELLLDYSAQVGYESDQFSLVGGLTGRLIVTAEDYQDSLGERTFHHFGVAARLKLGNVQPGIHFRIPTDEDVDEIIDYVFGLNLGIQLN